VSYDETPYSLAEMYYFSEEHATPIFSYLILLLWWQRQ